MGIILESSISWDQLFGSLFFINGSGCNKSIFQEVQTTHTVLHKKKTGLIRNSNHWEMPCESAGGSQGRTWAFNHLGNMSLYIFHKWKETLFFFIMTSVIKEKNPYEKHVNSAEWIASTDDCKNETKRQKLCCFFVFPVILSCFPQSFVNKLPYF